jgi:hypothetical protein
MLIVRLGKTAERELREAPRLVWAADRVASCEALGPGPERLLLVSAVRAESALWGALFGERLLREFGWLAMRRAIHGNPS